MPDFRVRHPDWQAKIDRWLMLWDFYRGGQHVLQPRRPVTTVWRGTIGYGEANAYNSSTELEDEPTRALARPRYTSSKTSSYLHSSVRETTAEYDDRVNKAVHAPLLRPIADIYVSATLRTGGDRGEPSAVGEPWATYWRNVDGLGTPIDPFERLALTYALVFGVVGAITDRPAYAAPAPSRAHQLARGDRPYTYLVMPMDIVDWQMDEQGAPLWVVIRENQPVIRGPGTEFPKPLDQYRVWTREGWELWRSVLDGNGQPKAGEFLRTDAGEHPCGRVPLSMLFARRCHSRRDTIVADGLLEDVCDLDRSLFNQKSLLLEQIYAQVYSQLCLPVRAGQTVPDVEMGPLRVLGFDAEAGAAPMYLSPDSSVLQVQESLMQSDIHTTRQLALVGRGRAEYSKEERSGATIALEQQDKHNVIASLAEAVQAFDRDHHELAALWDGQQAKDAPQAAYNKELTLKGVAEQLNEAVRFADPKLLLPPIALRHLVKPVYSRALRENGSPEKVITEGLKAIDDKAEEAERGSTEGFVLQPMPPGAAKPVAR